MNKSRLLGVVHSLLFFSCISIASFVIPGMIGTGHASLITVNVMGELGDEGLAIHNDFDFASFSGEFVLDEAAPDTNPSFGTSGIYVMESWLITLTPISGSPLVFESSGESLDKGNFIVDTNPDRLGLLFVEDFDGTNRMMMQVNFDPATALVNDGLSQVNLATLNRATGDFQSGLNQFGLSQYPTTMASASMSAVPIPAAVWLFGSGLLGLIGIARRKQSA